MALEYFPCYHSYRKKIAKLSDQEVGRLFRSLLEYSETGETEELTGRESVAFDFIADDIDRAKESYEEKCNRNRKSVETRYERIRTNTNVYESYQDKDKTKTKTESKDKSEDIPLSASALGGMSQELAAAVEDWLAYKREKRQSYKDTGLKAFLTQVKNNADRYGDDAVIAVMQQSMSNGYQGVTWDKLKANNQRQNDPLNSHRLDWIDEVTL